MNEMGGNVIIKISSCSAEIHLEHRIHRCLSISRPLDYFSFPLHFESPKGNLGKFSEKPLNKLEWRRETSSQTLLLAAVVLLLSPLSGHGRLRVKGCGDDVDQKDVLLSLRR